MEKKMLSARLSARLQTIADWVTCGSRLADVGCDHAFLAIWLVQNGQVPSAVVSDVRPGPLSRAEAHIREAGLDGRIEARLSDGLQNIRPGEADTLVIAGMGGPLMIRILTEGFEKLESFREMILQPQSDIPGFRRFLLDSGLQITDERIVEEDGKFYPMMKVTKCGTTDSRWSEEEIFYGRYLLRRKDPVLEKYLQREERIQEKILRELGEKRSETAEKRREDVLEDLRILSLAKALYAGVRTACCIAEHRR